jgi:transposase
MDARDFRGIGRPAQEALRRRALHLIEQQGLSQGEAARAVGVHRQTVNLWLKRYRTQGEDGVLDGRRVSPRRGKGVLSADEAARVQRWIADKSPDQLKLPFALWTSRAVRDRSPSASASGSGCRPCSSTCNPRGSADPRSCGGGAYACWLGWGMTPQKPLARARERSPAAIAAWLEQDYPAIANRAKAERAAIYWGDETGVSNQDQIGRSYAPRGQTPVVARTAKRITQSMISAVSNRGLMRFMLYDGALNADRFIAFLRRLIKDADQKVLLIVDNLKVHHAKPVTAWVAAHAHQIELCYLPAYAPDHNPDEYLNNDLKQKLRQAPQPGSKDALIKSTRAVLRAIQRSPQRIRAYFTPPPVRYAA